ncbi:hypothetical protein [Aeromicrobium sp.]|uniref:hypothetical protein n=1 Tax=Aeromicrobium sp. TaxID=1871063 RepID=UPI0030BF599D
MNSDYVLVSRWHVELGREPLWDVVEALLETTDPLVWWPSVQVTDYHGDDLKMRASSGLGYSVSFVLADLELSRPDRLTFSSRGDLRGRGAVTFVELDDDRTMMEIDWRVATDRRWMRWSAWLLRPVFVAGHHVVMRRGGRHFNRWLAARNN